MVWDNSIAQKTICSKKPFTITSTGKPASACLGGKAWNSGKQRSMETSREWTAGWEDTVTGKVPGLGGWSDLLPGMVFPGCSLYSYLFMLFISQFLKA